MRSLTIPFVLLATLGLASAQDAQTGTINKGAAEAQRPPSGAPPGEMQQSGPGTDVNDKAPGAQPGATPAPAAASADTGMQQPGQASGPIGATGETTPAKYSEKVDAADKTPIMARPIPLTDEQKRSILDAATEASGETGRIDAQPATPLPASVALHDLPKNVAEAIPAVAGLKYVKVGDRVLLVDPPNRIVVAEITR